MITFLIFSFVSLHHLVIMERYILNQSILQKKTAVVTKSEKSDRLSPIGSKDVNAFSYIEVLRFKFFFLCVKRSERYRSYEELTKVIRQRMDAQSIITNSGNISLLSSVLLKPY